MFWTPEFIAAAAQAVGNQNPTTTSGEDSAQTWHDWERTMNQYRETQNGDIGDSIKAIFWVVVALPGDRFSEDLEWHPDIPMFVPASGTGKLLGVVRSKEELDEMVTRDGNNVHLTYKVKIQGQEAWRSLLEFLATHGMLEKEAS